jgi:hypothetical protein
MFEKIDSILKELKTKLNSKNIDDLEFKIEHLERDADNELEKLMSKVDPKNEALWQELDWRIEDFNNLPEPKNSCDEFEKENLSMMFPDEDNEEGYNWNMD